MFGLIVTSAIGILFVAMSILFLTGRGSFLLAGYNTMSESEKGKYDTEALCRFAGKITLPIGILTFFLGFESIVKWYGWVYGAVVLGLSVFAAIYANTGARFKNK